MSIETGEVYETITSIEEAQKYPTQHRVQFTCVRCGTIANLKVEQIMKTKRLMCTKCSSQTAREEYQALRKSMSPEELLMSRSDMHITDIHEIDNVPNKRYITFNCTSCGALSGNEACRLREKGLLLCGDCMKKHTNNERFGVDYAAQRPEAREKTRQYNLEHKDEINAARAAAVERKYGPGITNVMQVQEHNPILLFRDKELLHLISLLNSFTFNSLFIEGVFFSLGSCSNWCWTSSCGGSCNLWVGCASSCGQGKSCQGSCNYYCASGCGNDTCENGAGCTHGCKIGCMMDTCSGGCSGLLLFLYKPSYILVGKERNT